MSKVLYDNVKKSGLKTRGSPTFGVGVPVRTLLINKLKNVRFVLKPNNFNVKT